MGLGLVGALVAGGRMMCEETGWEVRGVKRGAPGKGVEGAKQMASEVEEGGEELEGGGVGQPGRCEL